MHLDCLELFVQTSTGPPDFPKVSKQLFLIG